MNPERNKETKIKLTHAEKEKLQKKAEELGLRLGTYIRMVVLSDTKKKNA